MPSLVGILLAAATIAGLGVATAFSVRTRRQDYATLRALGLTRAQLRRCVAVQGVATMAGAALIAIPLGLLLGRAAWTAFAAQLGVLRDPTVPILALLATILGALILAWAVSLPAQMAAMRSRTFGRPATGLAEWLAQATR